MKAILSLLFVLAATPVFATENVPQQPAPTLKEHMINLDKMYKAVVKQINTPAQNPSSITMFQTMEKLGYECIAMLPARSEQEAADPEKRLKEILYQKMMSQLLIMVLEG